MATAFRSWLFRMVLLVALGLGSLTGCVDDDEGAETTSLPATTEPATQATSHSALAEPAFGGTEVQTSSVLPLLRVEWTSVDLEAAGTDGWLMALTTVGQEFVAVGSSWTPGESPFAPGIQTVNQWRSADGPSWDLADTTALDGWMDRIVVVDDHLLAMGTRTDETGRSLPLIWIDDGSGWVETEVSWSGDESQSLYLSAAASTPAGVVMAGNVQPFYRNDPMELLIGEFRIVIDDFDGTYVVIEEATQRTVAEGPTTDIYPWTEAGQLLFDADTGDILTTVPWEVWDDLYPASTPLPIYIPIPSGNDIGSIEWDGYRITVEGLVDGYDSGTYEVVDLDTGRVSTGSLDELYRGPGPRFFDRDTGELALAIDWDEWDRLTNEWWETSFEPHEPHDAEVVVLFSDDITADPPIWQQQSLALPADSHLETLVAVGDHFVATVQEHDEYAGHRTAFVSDDGLTWERTETEGPDYLHQLVPTSDGVMALSSGEQRAAVVSSSDGLTWDNELSIGPQSDGRDSWLDLTGAGPMGTVVTATVHGGFEPQVLEITIDELTARFGQEFAMEIFDATGETRLALTWEHLERPAPGDHGWATYVDGETHFWNAEGDLVMTIPDETVWTAYEDQSPGATEQTETAVFIRDEAGKWFEATPPTSIEPGSNQFVSLGVDTVVIGRTLFDDTGTPHEGEGEYSGHIGLLVGTVAD